MLKVLVFSHEFPPHGGGAGVVALQTASSFASIGLDVSVLTKENRNYSFSSLPFAVKTISAIPKLWFLSYRKALNVKDYDIVVLNDQAAIYVAGLYLSASDLKKCIAFLHGSEPEFIFEKPNLMKRFTFFRYFFSRALDLCSAIVSPSVYMKTKFLERTGCAGVAEKIHPIYYGVDSKIFFPDKDPVLSNEFETEGVLVFLSVSRIERDKGYLKKFEIFKRLLAEGETVKWIIIGTGNFSAEFEKLVKYEGLEDHIIFVGRIGRDKLRHYYSMADLFWLLSDYDESFGLVYVEAQLCGVPCIGYRRAGVVEAIKQNYTGFLVSDQEECFMIIKSKKYILLNSETIASHAKSFSLESYTENLLMLIDECAKG